MERRHRSRTTVNEEYAGQTLITTDHEVIFRWAQERGAKPARASDAGPHAEPADEPGALRFDLPGDGGADLERVTWDDWLDAFDRRGLRFVYQEHLRSGRVSDFFRLERPDGGAL